MINLNDVKLSLELLNMKNISQIPVYESLHSQLAHSIKSGIDRGCLIDKNDINEVMEWLLDCGYEIKD